jgi:hypothetical protein
VTQWLKSLCSVRQEWIYANIEVRFQNLASHPCQAAECGFPATTRIIVHTTKNSTAKHITIRAPCAFISVPEIERPGSQLVYVLNGKRRRMAGSRSRNASPFRGPADDDSAIISVCACYRFTLEYLLTKYRREAWRHLGGRLPQRQATLWDL